MPPEINPIQRVRTFEQDVAESMQTKQASVLHVALAEQEHIKEAYVETAKKRTNGLLYFVSFLFILGAFGVAGYAYFFYVPKENATIPPGLVVSKDFVASDETFSVGVDLNNRAKSLALLADTSQVNTTLGTVTHIIPFISETAEDIKTSRSITSQEFFAFIGNNVPDIFKRSLVQDITFVRVMDEELRAGIVVQSNDYERTIVGLTAWEKTMISDLEKVFGYSRRTEVKELIETITEMEVTEETEVYDPKTKKTTLVTSTSTEPVSTFEEKVSYVTDEVSFGNSVRKNIELRIAKGTSGKEYLVYGFPERSTLIIAGSVEAFLQIMDRLPQANENMIE